MAKNQNEITEEQLGQILAGRLDPRSLSSAELREIASPVKERGQ